MTTSLSLQIILRIPVGVEDDATVCSCKIYTQSTRTSTQKEDEPIWVCTRRRQREERQEAAAAIIAVHIEIPHTFNAARKTQPLFDCCNEIEFRMNTKETTLAFKTNEPILSETRSQSHTRKTGMEPSALVSARQIHVSMASEWKKYEKNTNMEIHLHNKLTHLAWKTCQWQPGGDCRGHHHQCVHKGTCRSTSSNRNACLSISLHCQEFFSYQ